MKPMLAAKTDGKGLSYPLLASPKLDEVRALIINGVVMSRSFKPIPNAHVQELFGRPEYNGLDGELIVGSPTDQATREALWKQRDQLPEQVIKYKFFASGVKDKPRFPVFLGFRSDL